MADSFEMVWIDTPRIPAEMVKIKSIRNRSAGLLVDDTVRAEVSMAAASNATIAIACK